MNRDDRRLRTCSTSAAVRRPLAICAEQIAMRWVMHSLALSKATDSSCVQRFMLKLRVKRGADFRGRENSAAESMCPTAL